MKKVFLQFWEESEKGWGVRPDGCSLHINVQNHKEYLCNIYKDRDTNNIPNIYDKIVGDLIIVSVKKDLYELVEKDLTVRLLQYELFNLIKLREIIC